MCIAIAVALICGSSSCRIEVVDHWTHETLFMHIADVSVLATRKKQQDGGELGFSTADSRKSPHSILASMLSLMLHVRKEAQEQRQTNICIIYCETCM